MTKVVTRHSVWRDLGTVFTGAAGSQLIGIIILPILARSFAPEAFGYFQLYLSILIVMTVGIGLRIELSLLSISEDDVGETLAGLLGLTIVTSVFCTIATSIYDILGPGLDIPPYLIGFGLAANGLVQATTFRLIRERHFHRVAYLKFVQIIVYAIVALAFAFTFQTVWGIILADIAGRLAAAVLAARFMRAYGISIAHCFRPYKILGIVKQNWELAVVSLPGALANAAGAMMTPIMIFQVFGAAVAGQYSLVERAIGLPVAMIISAGSQVFAGRIAQMIREQKAKEVYQIFIWIISIVTVVAMSLALVAHFLFPLLFGLFFGPEWRLAASFAQTLVFAYAAALSFGLVNQTLIILRAFRQQTIWDFCKLFGMSGMWLAIHLFELDVQTSIILHVIILGLLGLLFILLCLRALRKAAINDGLTN